MAKNKLQQLLNNGIFGTPETLPEERAFFLSTIKERVYLALTNKQVIHKGMYQEVLELMKTEKNIRLFINGDLSYQNYSNYLKEAAKLKIPFTVVNDGHETPIGLVLANEFAIDSERDIFIEDDFFQLNI